ncbi:SurA N-terminal domain-containing protein [Alkalihalobacillus sp. FSL W8-0930]
MQNKFILGISAFALAVGLAACSGETDENAESQNEQNESQTEEPTIAETNFEDIPDVVATINGVDLLKDDFVVEYNQAKEEQLMMGGQVDPSSTEVDDQLKDQSVNFLVDSELLMQASNEEDVEVTDEEVNAQLDQFKAMYQVESDEELEELFGDNNVTIDEFRENIREGMKPQKYIEQKAQIEDPTDEEIQSTYDEIIAAADGEEEPPALEDVEDTIAEQLKAQKTSEAASDILEELREQGDVEIFV